MSGPCGIKLRAAKAKAKAKAVTRRPSPVVVDFGKEMNAELRAEDRAKAQAAIPGRLFRDMMNLAAAHRAKADELEKTAKRMRFLA